YQPRVVVVYYVCRFFSFFFSSRRRHTRCYRDWSSDVCSSDLHYKRYHRSCQSHLLPVFPEAILERHLSSLFHGKDGPMRATPIRSEERRVGKESRCQWSP